VAAGAAWAHGSGPGRPGRYHQGPGARSV